MISLMATGDVMVGRLVGRRAEKASGTYPFTHIAEMLERGDVVLGNLECPLSGNGIPNTRKPQELLLRGSPQMAHHIKAAGFNLLSLANNHTFDYGVDAFRDTTTALDDAGIRYLGAGMNSAEASKSVVLDINGVRIAFLAYTYGYPARPKTPGCAFPYRKAVRAGLQAVKEMADHTVVSIHDGVEFTEYPLPRIRALAHDMIDWGATVVVGHHPHTMQGVEEYHGGIIAYSLGDFVFDNADVSIRQAAYRRTAISLLKEPLQLDDLRLLESIVLDLQLSKGGIESYQALPVIIGEDFQPRPAEGATGESILGRLEHISEPLQDPQHAVWSEMVWLERELRRMSLEKLSTGAILARPGKLRLRHLRLALPFCRAKLAGLLAKGKEAE